jgi:mono/diheme cytochrome c family protein
MRSRQFIAFVVLVVVALVPVFLLARADDGKTIYGKKCVNCHGTSGKGDGAGAAQVEKVFKKKVGDFTATDLSKMTPAEREAKIAALKKKLAEAQAPMSAFWKPLSPADQATVFEYVTKTYMKGDK